MKKAMLLVATVLISAAVGPFAHADSFTPAFTCSVSCVSTPTAPDVSFPSPTTITETWDGFTETLSLAAADLTTDTYLFKNFLGPSAGIGEMEIFDTTSNLSSFVNFAISSSLSSDGAGGSLTFSPVATPEPSSAGLLLLGIGLMFIVRKRIGPGLSLAI